MKTFARYLAFQVPAWGIAALLAWGLAEWDVIAWPWPAIGLVLYVAKDLFLFRFVRKAYENEHHDPVSTLESGEGVVLEALDPSGWVRVGSERWLAEGVGERGRIEPGTTVRVLGMRGHTLLVQAADELGPEVLPTTPSA